MYIVSLKITKSKNFFCNVLFLFVFEIRQKTNSWRKKVDLAKKHIKNGKNELNEYKLWYKTAPEYWDQGLPIGNGRLAAMVQNYDNEDVLTLNNEEVWVGNNFNRDIYPTGRNVLDNIRKMLVDSEYEKATLYAMNNLGRNDEPTKMINRMESYHPVGNLHIKYDDCELLQRELNIEQGVSRVKRKVNKEDFCGSFFVHSTIDKIFCSLEGHISCEIYFKRDDNEYVQNKKVEVFDDSIYYEVEFENKTKFYLFVKIYTDGDAVKNNKSINVKNAEYLILTADIGIIDDKEKFGSIPFEFKSENKDDIKKEIDEVLSLHSDHFSSYMKRMSLKIDSELSELPTDERLAAFKTEVPMRISFRCI